MRTLIRGSWVAAWDGANHELIRDGVCVVDGDRVVEVAASYEDHADRQLGGPGCLVTSGLISTHLHAGYNARDYVSVDPSRPEAAGRKCLNWQAGVPDRLRWEPAALDALRFGLAQTPMSGVTTVVEVGVGGDRVAFARAVEEMGICTYAGISYRNASMISSDDGTLHYRREDVLDRFAEADFAEACADGAQSRFHPLLCPGHPDTCEVAVLERISATVRDREWPVTIHVGLHQKEFERSYHMHRASPYEVLDRAGLLGPQVLLGHAMIHRQHPWSPDAGDDLRPLAERHAVVSHSPIKFSHLGLQLESLHRDHDPGIAVTIGTDFAPAGIIAEMRCAMLASRVADRSFLAGTRRLAFDTSTVSAADALSRPDLGRLAPGAKADVAVFDLDHLQFGAIHDPIRSLVETGSAPDLRWSLVDGESVVEDGRLVTFAEAVLRARARADGHALWSDLPNWYPGGRSIDDIVAPSYLIR